MTTAVVPCSSCRLPSTLHLDTIIQRGYLCDSCASVGGWTPMVTKEKTHSMVYEQSYGTVDRRNGEMSVKGAGWKRGCEFWLGLCCGSIQLGTWRV